MKKLIVIVFMLTALPSYSQMTPQWKNFFGVPLYSTAYAKQSISDSAGNIYVLNDVVNYNTTENTCHEPVLRKINPSGITLWHIQFSNVHCIGDQSGLKLAIHKNYLYVTYTKYPSYQSALKFFATKISLEGTLIWEKELFTSYTSLFTVDKGLQFDNNNNVYVSCPTDYRIWKLNYNGEVADTFKVIVSDTVHLIYNFTLSQNKIFTISTLRRNTTVKCFLNCSNFNGSLLWSKELPDCDTPQLLIGRDNSIYEYHTRYETLIGNFLVINKYNEAGNLLWSKESMGTAFGGYLSDFYYYPILINSKDGNLVLAYNSPLILFSSSTTGMIKKFSSSTGDSLWTIRLVDLFQYISVSTCVIEDSSGFIYSGSSVEFPGYYTVGNSYAILKISSEGNIVRKTVNDGYMDGRFFPAFLNILPGNNLGATGYYDTQSLFYSQEVTIRYSQPLRIFEDESIQNKKFSLLRCYPNPFNPNTVISFQLPVQGFVNLTVYDINGRVVSNLVNEKLEDGEYKINFDGSGLTSGIYFYKLTSGEFSETKKMMLVK